MVVNLDCFERTLPPSIRDRIDALAFVHGCAEPDAVQRLLCERFRFLEERICFLADQGPIVVAVCEGVPLTEAAEVGQTTLNVIRDVVLRYTLIELFATNERELDLDEPTAAEGRSLYEQLSRELQAFRMDDEFDDDAGTI